MWFELFCEDCLEKLSGISEVDMILADPPYGATACKWDSMIPLEPMWKHLKRVIKSNGAIVMTASQPFTTTLIASNMQMFKYCWIWVKTKPSGYQIAKIKPLSKYEDVTVFGIGKLAYYPQMVLRDSPRTGIVHRTNNQMKVSGGGIYREKKTYTHRYPTTVLKVANGSQKGKFHPTQKPVALMEYLIKTYTNVGETVLDFVMGSGTTGVACMNTGRNFIGIEKEIKYYEIAKDRIKKAKEKADFSKT